MRPRLLALLLGAAACDGEAKDKAPSEGEGEGEGEPALEPVCAPPSGEGAVGAGDANHDGRVDVSDGVTTLRYTLNGGDAPACLDAVDLLSDDLVDLGDGLAIFYYLFTGQVELPDSDRLDCASPTPVGEASCGRLLMALDAPEKVTAAAGGAATAQVGVLLTSPDLDVQAWSFGVRAEGCTITAGAEDGTAIADVRLDPEGRRDDGFARSDVVADGLTHGAVLSWKRDVVLSAREEAWRLLTLEVGATAPSGGCITCELKLSDTLEGAKLPVNLVVTSGGRSYTPSRESASFEVCAE